jgi:hypothetical protein
MQYFVSRTTYNTETCLIMNYVSFTINLRRVNGSDSGMQAAPRCVSIGTILHTNHPYWVIHLILTTLLSAKYSVQPIRSLTVIWRSYPIAADPEPLHHIII